jgi:hypothetical protein
MNKYLFLCCAITVLFFTHIAAAGTNVVIAFDQLLTDAEADGAPELTVNTNFFFDDDEYKLQLYCQAGTNVTTDPANPVFLSNSTFRLVLFGLAVENEDPNRLDRNDIMQFTLTILDDGEDDVTDEFATSLTMISINDRSDGITNVILYCAGDSVSYVPESTTVQGRELPFGPAPIIGPVHMTTDNPYGNLEAAPDALVHIRRLHFDVVPEPGMFALLGIAAAALLRRKGFLVNSYQLSVIN